MKGRGRASLSLSSFILLFLLSLNSPPPFLSLKFSHLLSLSTLHSRNTHSLYFIYISHTLILISLSRKEPPQPNPFSLFYLFFSLLLSLMSHALSLICCPCKLLGCCVDGLLGACCRWQRWRAVEKCCKCGLGWRWVAAFGELLRVATLRRGQLAWEGCSVWRGAARWQDEGGC